MDPVRKLFAKANGVDASLFSFNSKGATNARVAGC
jgi:excinuclease UvrABC ATPase subunit